MINFRLVHFTNMLKYKTQSNIIKSILTLLFISIIFNACQQSSVSNKIPETKDIQTIKLLRLDKDLFETPPSEIGNKLKTIQSNYGEFYNVYFLQIMNFGSTQNEQFTTLIGNFIQNSDFKTLAKDCDSIYNSQKIEALEENITEVFAKYQALYPNDTLPKVCTFISGFNNGIVTTDGYIGIGLDLFLGENYKFYPSLEIPDYLTRRYTPEHLMPMFVKGMASYKYPFDLAKPRLIDVLVNEGKMLYFLDQMLPDTEDSLKIGYTNKQLEWSKSNEKNIYQLLIDEGLFSADYLKYRKYTEEAPFTVSLTDESAPRIAWYCGWQVIKKFMDNNPDYTLDMLMKETDSQKILSLSKYKP
jgi:hypothetical protein